MDDLVQFLLDRLNDDETFMRAAIRLRESGAIVSSPQATEGAFALVEIVQNDPDTAEALTLYTRTGTRAPGEAERVLDEVESKRRIIGRILSHATIMGWDEVHGDLLRSLAIPYAGHADYKDKWRP